MAIAAELLEILVCPKCKGPLTYQVKSDALLCGACSLLYPIRDGIPVMLEEEAVDQREGGAVAKATKALVAYFKIKEGPNQGEVIKLPSGSCKAIGRSIDDVNKTQVFSLESTVPLDDFTKKVVLNYISKKMGKPVQSGAGAGDGGLGSFKRLPDLVLNDPAISRLHAMIFHDETGAGVLDLVSRNGTYVNGQEVESRPLKEGDLIEIGVTKIAFSFNPPR